MLTRRHIRVKVMQSVYSFSLSKSDRLESEVAFFKGSVAATFDLYLLLLALIKAVAAAAEEQLETYRKNKIEDQKRIAALELLLQNSASRFIVQHPILAQLLKNKKIDQWDLEFKFLKDLINLLFESEAFAQHTALEAPNAKDDVQLLVYFFRHIITPHPYLFNYLEDRELTWVDDLPIVNTFLLKTLKKIKVNDVSSLPFPQPVVSKEDMDFGVDLLEKVIGNEASLEYELIGKTPNWDPDRIAQLDAIILKIAIGELLYFPSIPPKVTLNEYLEIAKDYSTPKSNHFVNGVLDKLVKEFSSAQRLQKSGRGLQ